MTNSRRAAIKKWVQHEGGGWSDSAEVIYGDFIAPLLEALEFYASEWGAQHGHNNHDVNLFVQKVLNQKRRTARDSLTAFDKKLAAKGEGD